MIGALLIRHTALYLNLLREYVLQIVLHLYHPFSQFFLHISSFGS